MDFTKINSVYFIGIGGIGMSALARYFNAAGKKVSGYDKTPTPLTDELRNEGIEIHFEENIERIPKEPDLVIFTPAIPENHSEYRYCIENGFTVMKRAEVLGQIAGQSFSIAVAGTHGKTTTSSIIAHILKQSGTDCTAFLGGITLNYNSNVLLPSPVIGKGNKGDKVTVVEADEYDRSFLTLHPDIAVITSMDADHLDVYGAPANMKESFNLFAGQVKKDGILIIKKGLNISRQNLTYSLTEKADYYAMNITIDNGAFMFDVMSITGNMEGVRFGMPGRHNAENAVAAIAAVQQLGINNDDIIAALSSYKGVQRRFEYIIKTDNLVFIDDYAHHPEELKACINAVREMHPGRKITGIFQPHLYTRTRDFADEFGMSLALLDELILLDIYPAREEPIEGINSEMLLGKIDMKNKIHCSESELTQELANRRLEVILTLGAGDIDALVEPIKNELLNEKMKK